MKGILKRMERLVWVGILLIPILGLGRLPAFGPAQAAFPPPAEESGAASQPQLAPTGTIAYLRGFSSERTNNATEIRLIEADGSMDRQLWDVPNPDVKTAGLHFLDWSPDGRELAFTSGHEDYCSIYASDLYGLRPDGSGLRRITNGPTCSGLASYPQGSVKVTVANFRAQSVFVFVYVQGAPSVQSLSLAPGETASTIFDSVADLGPGAFQQAVVVEGLNRHIAPIAGGDVLQGQQLDAGTITITTAGIRDFGAHLLSWRSDHTAIDYNLNCSMRSVAAQPFPGSNGDLLLTRPDIFGCILDSGPTPALAGEVLYSDMFGDGIFRVKAGEEGPGPEVVDLGGQILDGLKWLPDGSGFLYSQYDIYLSKANIYRYDFATQKSTQLTFATNEIMGYMDISPDGQWVVFQRYKPGQSGSDLWTMRIDGSELNLLVQDGSRPAWMPPVTGPEPSQNGKLFLPLLR